METKTNKQKKDNSTSTKLHETLYTSTVKSLSIPTLSVMGFYFR